jgi:hypothetical protein
VAGLRSYEIGAVAKLRSEKLLGGVVALLRTGARSVEVIRSGERPK